MASSLASLAKMPEFITASSTVPPLMAETTAWSLPSAPL
jgi:hypothetical protein